MRDHHGFVKRPSFDGKKTLFSQLNLRQALGYAYAGICYKHPVSNGAFVCLSSFNEYQQMFKTMEHRKTSQKPQLDLPKTM